MSSPEFACLILDNFFRAGHIRWGSVTLFFVFCPMIVSGVKEFLIKLKLIETDDSTNNKHDVTKVNTKMPLNLIPIKTFSHPINKADALTIF